MAAPRKVGMFVCNACTHDARVLKEAASLHAAGYQVFIYAYLEKDTPPEEDRDGVIIRRVPVRKNPAPAAPPVEQEAPAALEELRWGPFGPFQPSCLARLPGIRRNGTRFESTRSGAVIPCTWMGSSALFLLAFAALVVFFRCYRVARWLLRRIRRAPGWFMRKAMLLFPLHGQFVHPTLMRYYRGSLACALEDGCDIIHAHDLNSLWVGWKAAKRLGAKLVYDSHELYVDRNRLVQPGPVGRRLMLAFEGFLARRCDAVITVNQSIADIMAERYRIPVPVVVMNVPLRDALEAAHIETPLREALGIPPERKLVLYTGRITFNRGLHKVVESLQHLPEVHLVLMGYGDETFKAGLVETAQRIGAEERFSFFGPVPHEEVTAYAAGADIGIAPIENVCLSYYYCSPNKMFEYLLAGLPVAVSDFPELRKLAEEHNIGRTFNPDDPVDIARALRELWADPEAMQAMRERAREAAQAFSWDGEAEKLRALYRGLEADGDR